jgi:hypothetical protein
MEHLLKELETLPNDELERLIAHAQELLRQRTKKVPFAELLDRGIWKDRQDMEDSVAWVRRERERWNERLTRKE